jgi:nucleotide-binding universal stress UspA family protein
MYRRMLVALDGSRISEAVLPYARSFAKALKPPVELLQVIDPEHLRAPSESSRPIDDDLAEARNNSSAYLSIVAKTFPSVGTVECSVEVGNPAEVIANRAAAESETLIAMATHGRSGFQRWLLGSVARKVATIAANPLLLVRAMEESETSGEADLKRVLVALDGSESAEIALPHATDIAGEMLIETVLLQVYDPCTYERLPRIDQIKQELKAEAEAYLEKKARELEAAGLEEVSCVALEGYPAAEIVDITHKMPDSLMVITTHGRSGVQRWLLGSVTERVIHHATGPVLIIRVA